MILNYNIVKDYPKTGVNFIDMHEVYLTQLTAICDELQRNTLHTDAIVAIGSRGWVTGSVLADRFKLPIFLMRDKSKCMPNWIFTESFDNEYDSRQMGISPTIKQVKNVTIVDDLIATGNTIMMVEKLMKNLNIKVSQILATIKLKEFNPKFDSDLYYIQEV